MSRPKIQYGAESHTSMIFLLKLKKLLFIKSNQTNIKHSHSSNSHTKHYTIRNIIDPLQHGLTLPNPNRIQYFFKTTSSPHTFSSIKIYIYNSYNLLQQILRHFGTTCKSEGWATIRSIRKRSCTVSEYESIYFFHSLQNSIRSHSLQ